MKYLISSDIHGSAHYAALLAQRFESEGASKMLLLGDILYHGPRNALPEGHDCQRVSDILNALSDKIIAVRGNCDAEVDQLMLNFPMMADYAIVETGSLTMFLSHGHRWNPANLPPLKSCNALIYGHTHIPHLEREGEIIVLNPGSAALPRGGFPQSFAIFEDGVFTIKDFDGNIISKLDTN